MCYKEFPDILMQYIFF